MQSQSYQNIVKQQIIINKKDGLSHPFFINNYMIFNWFRRKKKEREPQTFDGRFITDEEIKEMTHPKRDAFFSKDVNIIQQMWSEVLKYKE